MNMAVDITKHFEELFGRPVSVVSPDPVSHWCMILVRPGYEQECRDSLRRRGVGAWWPNFAREIGYKDRQTGKRGVRRIMLPVLPGVLLSPAQLTETFWQALDCAPGALNVARRFNAEVILLNDLDVVLIHKIEQGLNISAPPRSEHSYTVGDRVRFIADELRRFGSGEVIECHRDGRLRVDVNMLGRITPWIVASWQIESVETGSRIGLSQSSPMRGKGSRSHPRAR